jgi:acyl transferase domain-containing protein/NAD(P)-dependent dehydrogenase (short-subunit alcohol dehydrogenase family)
MTEKNQSPPPPVAIIGMGGMFAKSKNIKEYWRNLVNGVDCITDPPSTHSQLNALFDADPKKPDHIYCNRGGFLPAVPFDPTEFGIPPNALEATDTSQLLGLTVAQMALTDAGYDENRDFDREHTSVILGVTGTQELVIALGSRLGHPFWRQALEAKGLDESQKESIIDDISDSYVRWQESSFPGLLGNVVAGRICNRLNLGGTNCVVDAACASSLSAIHLGLMELYTGKSNMVITGGVDTINDSFMHMCFSKTGVLSHTGDARPFSADADGTVLGEGIGMLVLKRLADAERDGDRVYATIRGIGSSSDGKSQSIYAPRADGQARALNEAYRHAGISPDSVAAIEAHGTGTRVGDEVEFSALKKVFGAINPNGNRCALGSVKSMIGHTKAAAGAAGLIKSALSLHNKVFLPTIKADDPDPKLGIESSPFYLNTRSRPWFKNDDTPRRSGVSSFGFGGSNFHVVLQEYQPAKKEIAWDGAVELLAFSGPDAAAITSGLTAFDSLFQTPVDTSELARKARTLRAGFSRSQAHRLVMVLDTTASNPAAFQKQLRSAIDVVDSGQSMVRSNQGIYYCTSPGAAGKIAFMFPGQGSQYPHMGRDLVCQFPMAMQAVEDAGRIFNHSTPLWETLYPRPLFSKDQEKEDASALRRTEVAQPAIGAISLAMLSVLEYFNVRPDATCGHSYGELPALHAAGWLDWQTLITLSATRGRLMAEAGQGVDAGRMLAVKAPINALQAMVAQLPDVVLANINSPDQGVLSGTTEAIAAAQEKCHQSGYRTVALPVSAAFHSPLVESARAPFSRSVGEATFTPTHIPVYANVSATPYPDESSQAAELLGRQLTSPVRFQQMIQRLYDDGMRTFIEVGPKSVLTGLVRSILDNKAVHSIAVDRSSGNTSGIMDFAHALAQMAALGIDVDLHRWETPAPRQRTPKMVIPLSGTNYRSSVKPARNSFAGKSQASVSTSGRLNTNKHLVPPKPEIEIANEKSAICTASCPPPMKPYKQNKDTRRPAAATPPANHASASNPAPGGAMNDALALVQKGLESIQSLQQQTAQAHQKFLETQNQASRTLQEMMQSARMLIGSDLPAPSPVVSGTAAPGENRSQDLRNPPIVPQPPIEAVAPTIPAPMVSDEKTEAVRPAIHKHAQTTADIQSKDTVVDSVARELIQIVAELTGYPEEMLGLEMDIEADLGIDSIKRVEILSAMEERLPHLPKVTPDMVGTLKTLGQICDFLAADAAVMDSTPATATQPAVSLEAPPSDIREALLAIVAELTGYPEEMLGLEMDIEADLGIDSIKRVEILSAMEARLPHLPKVTPDMVGTLKTLGQICDFLAADAAVASPANENAFSPVSCVETSPTDIQGVLISIVAELTGYPEEMLGLEMDIEADLGIDSIKRVEILSAMEERLPHLPKVTPDMVGTLRTLRQLGAYLSPDPQDPLRDKDNGPATFSPATPSLPDETTAAVFRQVIDIVPSPKPSGRSFQMEAGRWIAVWDDQSAMAQAVSDEFKRRQIPSRLVTADKIGEPAHFNGAGGLILCSGTDPKTAFLAAKQAAPELLKAAAAGDALFTVVTGLDGAFGFSGDRLGNPEQGALPALAKTAAREWEPLICRAMDLSPDFSDADTAAKAIVDELLTVHDDDPVEIGLSPDRRVTLRSISAETVDGALDLDPHQVVVVTGGARGVTAACAFELARTSGVSIALIGRSAPPFDEPAWLNGVDGEAAIKKAIAANADFKGGHPTPKALEKAFCKYNANRSILQSLGGLRSAGVDADYFSADVSDRERLNAAITAIRGKMGPIGGLIHGAGVLHDRLIVDKTAEQFSRVYATKVDGFTNLIAATKGDDLRHIVLFSSVSARTGNTGQCDYAMANEALNKMARSVAASRPTCKVIAINWGPWDGGMVTPALKKAMERSHIRLIPVEIGAQMMVAEMQNAKPGPIEVIIGSMLATGRGDEPTSRQPLPSDMALLERREVDIQRYPILNSHVIGGKPVVPFALISEWIGHGALKENPGFSLHGIDDFRLLSGIRIEQEKKLVRVMAGKARKKGDAWQVDVELRNGVKNGKDVIHSRARALLVDRLPEAPAYKPQKMNGNKPYPKDMDSVYGEVLFHGDHLRAIRSIEAHGDHGMTARLANAPKPEAWMQDPIRERWMADPMVLDGAFQMAILWCFEHTGSVCLPSYARSYRQYRQVFPATGVTAVMAVTDHTHRKMVADFTFLDETDLVIATLSGYEATIDNLLIHAFKENVLDTVIKANPS